jgi:polygalacturonase
MDVILFGTGRFQKLALVIMTLLAAGNAPRASPGASRVCDAHEYGAVGDGHALDTAAIQRAVDDCARRGGGIALLSSGRFLSGTVLLKDHVTLRIARGATLVGSPDIGDYIAYPPQDVPKIFVNGTTQNKGNGPFHLIHAENVRDIAIDGGGAIDGNGAAFWDSDPRDVWVSRRARPSPLIEMVGADGVRVENIRIVNSPGWTIHPLESRNVQIRRVVIRNDGHGPNTDGIDIDSSSKVLVRNVDVIAGDDCVVLKTTGRRQYPPPPTQDVTVSNVTCSSDDQGIKIGTESEGDFKNIYIDNVLIYHAPAIYRPPTAGLSFSMVDGASFENLTVSNVVIRDAITPFFLRLGNRGRGQNKPIPGVLKNVHFNNIVATGGSLASSITGIPEHPIEGVSLRNVDITMAGGGRRTSRKVPEAVGDYPQAPMFGELPAFGLYVRHVRQLSISNVQIRTMIPDARPPTVFDDVKRRGRRVVN